MLPNLDNKASDTRNVIDAYKGWSIEDINQDLNKKRHDFSVAIENYQHDFNIGSIVRNANAFNARSVHIIGKRHWNRRGTMATEKYLMVYHHNDVEDFVLWANANNQQIYGVDNIKSSVLLGKTELPVNTVFVFGQEGPGLSSNMQGYCKRIIAIEQFGSTRSVNVGVASGILMYEWIKQNII